MPTVTPKASVAAWIALGSVALAALQWIKPVRAAVISLTSVPGLPFNSPAFALLAKSEPGPSCRPVRETSRRGRKQCGVAGDPPGECVAKIERFEIESTLTGVRLSRDLERVNDEAHVFARSVAKRH